MELRSYQSTALDKLRFALAGGKRRILLYSPTGSGKTEMGMAMIRGAIAKGKKVAFIANRKELVQQASRRFWRAGIPHGIVQAENNVNIGAGVLVCSIDTIHSRGLPDVDLIVIDEAHSVAGSSKYRQLLFQRNALPVIGLSATPFAAGLSRVYRELGGPLFEELVEATTIRELIDLKFLVDVDVFAPSTPNLEGVKTVRNAFGEQDYAEGDLAQAVDKPDLIGDIVTNWRRLAAGLQTVCFATSIAHSRHIVESFRAAGVPAEHIDCYTDDDERKAVLESFNRGDIRVLSNVGLLAEGWDAPATACMILARPTRSLIRWIQMVGRVLRPFDGKEKALLLDHSGTTARLGYPTEDLPLELNDGKASKRAQQPKRERLPRECPSCRYMKPAGVHSCPKCGFVPERPPEAIAVEEAELVKLDRKRQATRADKQLVFSELLWVAGERGYSDGWVAHKYRAFFGVWPRELERVAVDPRPETRSWVKSQQIRFAKAREKDGGDHAAAA
jgi:DNA repair protein RadD